MPFFFAFVCANVVKAVFVKLFDGAHKAVGAAVNAVIVGGCNHIYARKLKAVKKTIRRVEAGIG